MAESSGEGLNVVYDTTAPGFSPIATGNNNLVSFAIDTRYAKTLSVQILTDGGAVINYSLQVTDVPPSIINFQRTIFGATTRNDAYASTMWSTVTTGQLAAGGGGQGTVIVLATTIHRAARVIFSWDVSNAGGATGNIFAMCRTMGVG